MDGLAIRFKRKVIIVMAIVVAVLCVATLAIAMQSGSVAYASASYTDADVSRFTFNIQEGASSLVYNGSEQPLKAVVTLDGESFDDYSVTYFQNNQPIDGVPKDAGNYTAIISVNNSDPVISSGKISYKITQKPIKVVVSGADTFTYTGNPYTRNVSRIGVCEGDECEVITTYLGSTDKLEAGQLPRNVDDYDLAFTPSNPNYIIGEVEGNKTLKITKNTLTVTAKNVTITVGDALPELTYDIIGFCGTDGVEQISTMPKINTNASVVGIHDLIPSGGSSRNYNFNYVKGFLTINAVSTNGQIEGTSSSFTINGKFAPSTHYLGSSVEIKSDEAKAYVKTAREYRMLNFTSKIRHIYKLDIQNGAQVSEKVSISIDNVPLNAKKDYFIIVIDHNGVVSKVSKYTFVDGVLTFNSYGIGTVLVFEDNQAMMIIYITLGIIVALVVALFVASKITYLNDKKEIEDKKKHKKHKSKYQW